MNFLISSDRAFVGVQSLNRAASISSLRGVALRAGGQATSIRGQTDPALEQRWTVRKNLRYNLSQ
jgi:hypothetical protein